MAGTAAPLNPGIQGRRVPLLSRGHGRARADPAAGRRRGGAPRRRRSRPDAHAIDMDASGSVVADRGVDRADGRSTPPDASTTSRWSCTPAAAPGGPSACRSRTRNLSISAQNVARSYALGPDDVSLCVMPLFHVHGLVASTLATLATGGTVVVPGEVQSAVVLARRAGPRRHVVFGGADAASAAAGARRDPDRRGGPRAPSGCASSDRAARRCRRSVMHALEAAFGAPVLEAYGMTEAAHQMASNPLPPATRKPGSVGRGTDVQISIMDEDGRHLRAGRARRGRHQGPERHSRLREQSGGERDVVRRRLVPNRRPGLPRRRRLL